MSEPMKHYVHDDGSQVLFDPSTGKQYIVLAGVPNSTNTLTDKQDTNTGKNKNNNVISMSQTLGTSQVKKVVGGDQQTGGTKNQQMIKARQQRASQQQGTQKQTTTWKEDSQGKNLHDSHVSNMNVEHSSTSAYQHKAQTNVNGKITEKSEVNDDQGEDGNQETGKRSRTLNDSDDSINIAVNNPKKKVQTEAQNETLNEDLLEAQTELQIEGTTINYVVNNSQNNLNIPVEHLQRAIIHNLPCFTIKFRQNDKLPSVVAASEALYEYFEQHELFLNDKFSMIRYVGDQLKVGVKDKIDYHRLCDPKRWPSIILNKEISVFIPKFIPDQFTLVVGFIPADLTIEQVAKEVKRSACSADNFREIIYSYARVTRDFTFTVGDIKEYNGLLRLGHIGIGNRMRTVTPYRPANKLTYCTKCWLLGHTRNQCHDLTQKCRVCLHEYNHTHNEICSKVYKCAQCHENHYSLNADCQIIQQYRNKLNRAVKQAMQDGIVKRTTERAESSTIAQQSPQLPALNSLAFPPLTTAKTQKIGQPPPWMVPKQTKNTAQPTDISNQQLLEKICNRLDERTKETEVLILKIEQKTNTNDKSISEIRRSLHTIVEALQSLTKEVIIPISNSASNLRKINKEALDKVTSIINEQVTFLNAGNEINLVDLGNDDEDMDQQQQVEITKNSLIPHA